MGTSVLYDSVTLRQFAVAGIIEVLASCHAVKPLPRWTDGVRSEIHRAFSTGFEPHCRSILDCSWFDEPVVPGTSEHKNIYKLWVGLNGGKEPPIDHYGEAESIYFAEKLNGQFATDDNAAHDFAKRRMGPGRVIDTIDILRDAVALGEIRSQEAVRVVTTIRGAGRYLRSCHAADLKPNGAPPQPDEGARYQSFVNCSLLANVHPLSRIVPDPVNELPSNRRRACNRPGGAASRFVYQHRAT